MTITATELQRHIELGRLHPAMTFNQRVWTLTSRIPRGRVTTYAELAKALGGKGYRAVGQALNRNPYAPRVPCHRVVGSDGRLTGFADGIGKKAEMLESEGVRIEKGKVVGAEFFKFGTGALHRAHGPKVACSILTRKFTPLPLPLESSAAGG